MQNGFLTQVLTGQAWIDDLGTGPAADEPDRTAGADVIEEVREFVLAAVDPGELDRTGTLPATLLADLRARGFFQLALGPDLGGRGLSGYATFRAVEAAAEWSVTVGQILAIQNGVGAAALLPALPPGPLRDHVSHRVAEGALSGFAATEPAGQNNTWPALTAKPTADGTTYLLHGEKLFTGNGTVAQLLAVSATIDDGGPRRVGVCFVDTAAAGFTVRADLRFMGSVGLPNAALGFVAVPVPAEHLLIGEPDQPRLPPLVSAVALLGALYFTGAPASAVARQCARWSREFINRRRIDGRPLGGFDEIQRLTAGTLAEVYAIDSVVRCCLLGQGLTDRAFERLLAKNICAGTAWRIVDRTVSLMGGEGFETEQSKRDRGADPRPVERLFRDARGLRVAGNIDFRLDFAAGSRLLDEVGAAASGADRDTDPGGLSTGNAAHLRTLDREVRRLAEACRRLAGRRATSAESRDAHAVTLAGRLAGELFTVSAVLSRTHHDAAQDDGAGQELAHGYCVDAWHRVADLWRRLDHADTDHAADISRRWLADNGSSHPVDP